MQSTDRIFVAGQGGLVGSALVRRLHRGGYRSVVTSSHAQLDLTRQEPAEALFAKEQIDVVLLAAAKVGGIGANIAAPAEFIAINLAIATNVITAAFRAGVRELLFLGSSCIYPRGVAQPMPEAALLTGVPEPTNRSYAVAKIAGVQMCEAFNHQHGVRYLPVMPTNLYGPRDNYDLETSHVVPALIRKIHEAKAGGAPRVAVWGSGRPRREFLHVDDCADACVFLLESTQERDLTNIGCGTDVSIRELAETIARVVGYDGELEFDPSKPDGIPRKLLDVSKAAALGWRATIELEDGLRRTYAAYQEELAAGTARGVTP